MRVWLDILSGDEMVSDSYPYRLTHDDACLEVKAKFVTKKANEDFQAYDGNQFGGGEEEEAGGNSDDTITVIDVVESMRLQEINLDKPAFMAYIKEYLKKIKAKLEAAGKSERVPVFQKGATALTKQLIEKWKEIQIFTGSSNDWEGSLGFAYTLDGEEHPTFFFYHDGLRQEKF